MNSYGDPAATGPVSIESRDEAVRTPAIPTPAVPTADRLDPGPRTPPLGEAALPAPRCAASGARVDSSELALFRVHMFPIGHLPVATNSPAHQLPAPPSETDYAAGLRFPPHDHPRADLVQDTFALAKLRAKRMSAPPTNGQDATDSWVVALATGHDPLGERDQQEWDHRFLVRPADQEGTRVAEYAWPPGELYPEGGADTGTAEVLEPDTLLDRFGTVEGRIFADADTPFERRSLPPEQLISGYRRYRVLRRLPVWRTRSAAWFGQSGGGVRYRAEYPAADLVALGYLAELTEQVEGYDR